MASKITSTGPRCPRCGKEPENPAKSLCNACHAAHMRDWRRTHRLHGEARARANARAYLHVNLKRGKLQKQPCEVCGSLKVEAHHHDYSKPLEVRWLCRTHHLALTGAVEHVEVPCQYPAVQPQPGDCFSAS